MNYMKVVYYGFGAFIGLVCGTLINLLFYWLEKSGTYTAGQLVKDYGFMGRYLLEMINALPYIGLGLGILLVKMLFGDRLDKGAD